MPDAEFEEKEYEGPLYNQLEGGNLYLWSPGQVFEGHIGIDRAMFSVEDWVFRQHGYRGYLPGAVLSRYAWPQAWFSRRAPRKLPSFRLNLFVQAKRPKWARRPPAHVASMGVTGLYWKFNIDKDQQLSLQILACRLGARALVVYAAPVFHKHHLLFRHMRNGTIVKNSTFPSVAALTDHDTWYYNRPGASGVANRNPKFIEEPSLENRLKSITAELNSEIADDQMWRSYLLDLANGITDALSSKELSDTSRCAHFFERQLEIQRDLGGIDEHLVLTQYLTVLNFIDMFALEWFVVGSE